MGGVSVDSNLEAQKAELEAVLASKIFRRAPSLSRILRYVCEKHFEGEADTIKEYNVAVEALGRPPDFDPAASSVVRVEASRLRRRLRQYYETEGAGHRLQIQLSGSGYRPHFGLIEQAPDTPPDIPKSRPEATTPPVERRPRPEGLWRSRSRIWPVATAVLAFALAAVAAYVFHRWPTVPAPLAATPLTTYPGRELEPSLSPDGRSVAFVWDGRPRNNFDIYVKLIGIGDPVRLTDDPAEDFSPAWSPDGQSIVFLRRRDGQQADVFQVPALGGPEVKLAEIHAPEPWHLRMAGPFVTWSPDGDWLVVSDRESPEEPPALFLFSPRSGARRRLTNPPPGLIGDTAPAFSPDARRLAFARRFGPYEHEIFVVPLSESYESEGPPRQLTAAATWSRQPAWSADGREILFSRRSGLWRVPASGRGKPRRLAYVGARGIHPTVNALEQRLVYSNYKRDSNIWRLDLTGATQARPFQASSLADLQPRFSPQGDRIAFLSNRSGAREIWLCDPDGRNATKLTSLGRLGSPRWSPDGASLVFDHRPEGQSDIYAIDVSGRGLRRLTTSPVADLMPSWSTDGEWIYFGSNRTGEFQIWRVAASGGKPAQVTREGGVFAIEGPDGESLYVARRRGDTSLWKHSLDDATARRMLGSVNYHYFSVTRTGIYFVERGKTRFGGRPLRFLSFADDTIRTIHTLEKPTSPGIDISPDGQTLLFTQIDYETADLMLVEDFR